jgi:hypothetical protein
VPYDNSIRVAYHEAGHAVVTVALGFRLVSVEVSDDKGFSDHEPLPSPSFEKAVIRAAGRYAQMIWNPEANGVGCDDDDHALNSEVSMLEPVHGRDRDSIRGDAWQRSRQIVEDHWPAVEAFARLLLEQRTIQGDVATRAIQRMLALS